MLCAMRSARSFISRGIETPSSSTCVAVAPRNDRTSSEA